MIFTTVLAAAGITPPIKADERRAKVIADQAKIERERVAAEQRINESRSAVNTKAAADIARVAAEADAFELKLSREIASDLRKQIVPLFADFRRQPSRKVAGHLKTAIYVADQTAQAQLGARLCHLQLATCFVESILSAESPDLLSAASTVDFYHGPAIAAATRLLESAAGDYIVEFEKALSDLEHALEHAARTAPRSELTEEHEHSFEALCAYAVPSHRAHATQALTLKFANERAAKVAAEYKAPVSVESDGGVDVRGKQYASSIANYAPVEIYSPTATPNSDETSGDSVEHF